MRPTPEELVERHLGDAEILARWSLRRCRSASIDIDDLRQEAKKALLDAVENMDPERMDDAEDVGRYLRWKMRNGLVDFIRVSGPWTRSGVRRDPVVSLDVPIETSGRDSMTLLDTLAAPEPEPDDGPEVEPHQLAAAIAAMTAREREVITRHFLDNEDYRAIAKEMGISETRVFQLQAAALGRARRSLGLEGDEPAEYEVHLTDRETQVLYCAAEGFSADETAERLHCSAETIKSHRKHLIAKLGGRNMMHVLALSFRSGLIV